MPRTLWVVRHAEREDNINRKWISSSAKNPHGLKADNSPLSQRGRHQASELGKRFANQPIDHVIASPFERTMETATAIVAALREKQGGGARTVEGAMGVKVEPGLLEALYLCENPPSFEDPAALKERFPLVDLDYSQVFRKPMPREGYGDEACCARLQKTIDTLLERYPQAENLMLVSHGSPIGAIHQCLVGEWNYVGQATVSKFVEDHKVRGKFRLEFTSDASHLSDKSNLRAY